jgi:uncharacterized membrane protein YuzA (DUF378 family)
MDDDDPHAQILRLEVQIEEYAEAIERCRKLILISKVAIAVGGLLIPAMVLGLIRFDLVAMLGGLAAVFGGTVGFGSNTTTSEKLTADMKAADALRAELIGRINPRVVGSSNGGDGMKPTLH